MRAPKRGDRVEVTVVGRVQYIDNSDITIRWDGDELVEHDLEIDRERFITSMRVLPPAEPKNTNAIVMTVLHREGRDVPEVKVWQRFYVSDSTDMQAWRTAGDGLWYTYEEVLRNGEVTVLSPGTES